MRCLIFILLFLPFCSPAQNKIAFLSSTKDATTSIFDKYPSADNNKFLTDDRLIFIEASVNGEKGIFLLDTGAPTLVLNSSTSELSPSSTTKAFAVSSDLPVSFVQINQFEWGNFKKGIFEGLMLDLNHFEGPTHAAIDGLVGFDILDRKVLMVDFKENRVALLKYKDFKSIKKELPPSYSIPFSMNQHLPVLTVNIEGKEYKLALDTGAEVNLLHAPLITAVNPENIEYDLLQGLDKHIRKVAKGYIPNFSVEDYPVNQSQFLFTDLSHIQNDQYGYEIDGLLGLSFFEGRQFAIDYKKQEIHIW